MKHLKHKPVLYCLASLCFTVLRSISGNKRLMGTLISLSFSFFSPLHSLLLFRAQFSFSLLAILYWTVTFHVPGFWLMKSVVCKYGCHCGVGLCTSPCYPLLVSLLPARRCLAEVLIRNPVFSLWTNLPPSGLIYLNMLNGFVCRSVFCFVCGI